VNRLNFLKRFPLGCVIKMSEIKRFQDDYVLPKDILDRFTKYRKLSKTKEDVFEKFVVEDIQC